MFGWPGAFPRLKPWLVAERFITGREMLSYLRTVLLSLTGREISRIGVISWWIHLSSHPALEKEKENG